MYLSINVYVFLCIFLFRQDNTFFEVNLWALESPLERDSCPFICVPPSKFKCRKKKSLFSIPANCVLFTTHDKLMFQNNTDAVPREKNWANFHSPIRTFLKGSGAQ